MVEYLKVLKNFWFFKAHKIHRILLVSLKSLEREVGNYTLGAA